MTRRTLLPSEIAGLYIACTVLLAWPTLTTPVFAQESRATITGAVTDAQGAAVPVARIEARNLETNVHYDTLTTDGGVYTIPLIPVGSYSVTVGRDGFRRAIQPKVEVRTGERVQVDFKLEVGTVTRELLVTAEAPLLETATASRGQVISQEEIADLPVMGRNISMLATLSAGVQIPWRARRRQNFFDPHSFHIFAKFIAEDAVGVSQEVPRRLFKRKRLE